MNLFEIIFWALSALIVYSYVGYGAVLYVLVRAKRMFFPAKPLDYPSQWPTVTLLIAAYNERDFMPTKIANCLKLDYPKNQLRILFVTDGSNDGTDEYLKTIDGIEAMHQNQRAGKIGAMNRGMQTVVSDIVVFTDANTILNDLAIKNIVRHFVSSENVGCVAGEKRLLLSEKESAAGAGEGAYWKYESALKKWDSEIGSVVGAAGELFAIRTQLFTPVEADTLLDDFMISMRICQRGYKVVYEPEAQAWEKPTSNVEEEMKRKIRICAGGIQSIIRLGGLLNPFRHGLLTFQYVSHRVLRWSITPIAMVVVLLINCLLVAYPPNEVSGFWYPLLLALQLCFYILALFGKLLESKKTSSKLLFIPYFFTVQNLAVFLGMWRYFKGTQSVLWEKAKRAD